jgi:aminoglycoside phosphotransferase (APT) family kinase protein
MDSDAADEEALRRYIEKATGGRVIGMTRQARWRRAWYADVEIDGASVPLYVRGDRMSDVMPFPDLKREADILSALEAQGVLTPHIYGYCQAPSAIVMAAVPGSRNVAEAADDEERRSIGRQYIEEVARMHRVDVAPFVAAGVDLPRSAEDIALAGLNAYYPLYQRVKKKPEPLLEFALGWIKRNAPRHRTKRSFIQFDSGQFLFENGKLTCLYDFEFAMIGDPMADLATMRMRDSYEPLGDEFRNLCRHYEEASGEPVDDVALIYHNVVFALVGTMQFAGAVAAPQSGDPHAVYLEFDVALRRVLVIILAEAMGVEIEPPSPPTDAVQPASPLLAMLADAVAQFPAQDDVQKMRKEAADQLVEYTARDQQYGAAFDRQTLDEAAEILGERHDDWPSLDAALERYVQNAGPEEDERLLRFFHRQAVRNVQLYGPTRIGHSAQNVHLPPIR